LGDRPNVPGGIHPGDEGASLLPVSDLDAALDRVRELGGDTAGWDSSDDDPDASARSGA
jgi:hypothetical protein